MNELMPDKSDGQRSTGDHDGQRSTEDHDAGGISSQGKKSSQGRLLCFWSALGFCWASAMEGLQSKGAEESAREEFILKQADGCEKKKKMKDLWSP